MAECGQTDDVLSKCIQDVLSAIKPVDNDVNLRQHALKELEDSISSVETLTGAVIKPFGSFLSYLYTKSGDLDISLELSHNFNLPRTLTPKMEKHSVLRKLLSALETKGIPRDAKIIDARVPVLQYVSSKFGISCDISVDNHLGLIKSKVLNWVNTLDERFRDMVLIVKEWAKSQGINDPKNGTLNSYSLCLLVVFHFQTCTPAILPPLKEIYDLKIVDTSVYCEKDVDNVCRANIAKFKSQNTEPRNQSSLSHLFATFFQKFSFDDRTAVISTFEGQLMQHQKFTYSPAKSISPLLLDDPFERQCNTARTVKEDTIDLIISAFSRAKSVFVLDGRVADRNELLSLMCTPEVSKRLGVTAVPQRETCPAMNRFMESMLQQKLVEEDHIHHSDDMTPILRFLHIPGEVAEDDE